MFSESIPTKILRDLLSADEICKCHEIEHGGNKALVATCKKDDQDVFTGYYPLNAEIDTDDLQPHRVNGELDIMPVTTGG